MTAADLFSTSVKRAVEQSMTVAELLSTVEQLNRAKETTLVLELYNTWIRHNGANPLLFAVYFNFGTALSEAKELVRARDAFAEAIRIKPDFAPPYINLGNVLEKLGQLDQAVAQWTIAANHLASVNAEGLTYKTTALKQIGRVLEGARLEPAAEDALKKCLELDAHQKDVIQHWIALRQVQCKWPVVVPWGQVTRKQLMRSISPLSAAVYTDDPLFQLANAHAYISAETAALPQAPALAPARDRVLQRRLRIGYVSSDLREHAVGFLTSEIFELHDKTKVEVFAYYCGIAADDATKKRIAQSVEHWVDIRDMTDEQAAQKIAADKIDILVDLNGYTKDARLKVFAMRPAPIIVNWLGYPGSLGSGHHNYIIADDTIIPADDEKYYTEKVLRLPCYQPTDRKRVVSERHQTREEMKLPADAMVFCCFNGTQKLSPGIFAAWMAILKAVPNGVLWLLSGTAETNERLSQMAANAGVDRGRLIFAEKRINPEHLARYPLADLFLDTLPYGAHTTASDAMWMGVPIVTVSGRTFASRVCGSLATAAGIGELVCDSIDAYVAKAIELAGDRSQLARLRARLRDGRDTCVLFDTPGLVRSLEGLYAQMWNDYARGQLPQPDLSNLELIHDIGCSVDRESEEWTAIGDIAAFYRSRMQARHAHTALQHDPRLSAGTPGFKTAADDVTLDWLTRSREVRQKKALALQGQE